MRKILDPVETWVRYGLSDLYFGSRNQKNDVCRYGIFFYIMAAEKHLKAVLIDANRANFDGLTTIESKKAAVDGIARKYSHNFKIMIRDVSTIYERDMNSPLIKDEHLGFKSESLIQAMYEGYMETRYPSVLSTSRHLPAITAEGMFHDPLGSSFFTDFIERICTKCWTYLISKNLNASNIISGLEERFGGNDDFEHFKAVYLAKLPSTL